MAKSTLTPRNEAVKPLIPVTTDHRSELFFLLGRLQGAGIEGADRITVLVAELTKPQPTGE
jgi:hypothetical protein